MNIIDELSPSFDFIDTNLDEYQTDYSGIVKSKPLFVVFPKSLKQCQKLVKLANKYEIPLIVRGAGSGTTGGVIPLKKHIVCSLEKMNNIIDFDIENAMITVEAGVILKDLQTIVESESLFYPLDPASLDRCTIGGNIAENAGGARALKYGVTRDYVIGLTGVWGNGDIFKLGGKQLKNVAGFDLIRLLVGSEGTLALITEIILKLIPKPKVVYEGLACFDNPEDAIKALVQIRKLGIQPSTAEYMTEFCVEASIKYLGVEQKFKKAKAYIIWQIDGFDNDSVEKQLNCIKDLCSNYDSSNWFEMNSDELSDHIWKIRRSISLGLKLIAGSKKSEDVVVPPAKVPSFLKELESMNHQSGIKVLGYGHLGDGNIHVNILKMDASESDWLKSKDEVVKDIMEKAVAFGGTISGEHGIGMTKKEYMQLVFSPTDIDIMKKIKLSIDPKGILNPGKIFD